MSEAGWYQRKLAQLRQTNAPRPYRPIDGYPQRAVPAASRNLNAQPHNPPPAPPQQVTIDNLYEAMGYWHGGKAHQVDKYPCPRCGSNQFFSRTEGIKRGPPPAPHCYNCGYNEGMFEQGLASTWGA